MHNKGSRLVTKKKKYKKEQAILSMVLDSWGCRKHCVYSCVLGIRGWVGMTHPHGSRTV